MMRRGEIRLVDLDPVRGSEANKQRPAVVVSNDRANSVAQRLGRGVVTVVPLTSNVARVFPFQVLIPADIVGLRVASKAQAEQVRSVAVERVGPSLGLLQASLLAEIDDALRLHLDL
ncbi:type II toxin-antitoxin system PemK/MazF family toxin [Nakamurella sp. UYEF19]|uniref:type II toxin-antitoxin system PemK/MazF family toxin n=1 Tax=Nakamurella sp. UYEF19 TaxID=1756392 RepID=UPI0033979E9C